MNETRPPAGNPGGGGMSDKELYEITQDYVVFYSPGTFVSETNEEKIDSLDIKKAIKMSKNIKQRYGATPYGFSFSTRGRKKGELYSREIKRSGTYYLGGKILTLPDIKKRNDPNDIILISNMEINKIKKVVENCNSWKVIMELKDEDMVLQEAEQ